VGRGGRPNGPNNDGHAENNEINGEHGLIMYGRRKVSVFCRLSNISEKKILYKRNGLLVVNELLLPN
jgi:hypothetical protein